MLVHTSPMSGTPKMTARLPWRGRGEGEKEGVSAGAGRRKRSARVRGEVCAVVDGSEEFGAPPSRPGTSLARPDKTRSAGV